MSGDMGELFNDLKEDSKQRRARNRLTSPSLLARHGYSFVSKNAGAHLIVEDRYDFWPGTGKWHDRQSARKGRGVFRLIEVMKGDSDE